MVDRLISGLDALGLELPERTIDQQLIFLAELLRWNQRINLTAIRDPKEALEKHLLDSLVLLNYVRAAGRLLDMGSGGGLPGIPLAIACAELRLISVDSVGKKINFQRHIKRKLVLENFQPIHCRLEELDQQIAFDQNFDQVVARAFASFAELFKLSAPWLQPGGELLAMKGPEGCKELAESEDLLAVYGFQLKKIDTYRLPFSGAERQILLLEKT